MTRLLRLLLVTAWNWNDCFGFFVGPGGGAVRNKTLMRRRSRRTPRTQLHEQTNAGEPNARTKIRSIRTQNLAGMTGTIVVEDFDESLIAITGETGTGKSLLFAKTIELLTGVKAPLSLLGSTMDKEEATTNTFCELELNLSDVHVELYRTVLRDMGLDGSSLPETKTLTARRTLSPGVAGRVKSECHINGQKLTLKRLASIIAPLVTIVDAPAAAAALSKPSARLALLDASLASVLKVVQITGERYRTCRREREDIEAELSSLNFDPVEDQELLEHWIEELDAFATRVTQFCRNCVDPEQIHGLRKIEWGTNQSSGRTFVSAMYELLKGLQGDLRTLEDRITSIQGAIDALSLLSVPNSAMSALENARRLISNTNGDLTYEESQEKTHEMLNQIEADLRHCARYLEDDPKGLLQRTEQEKAKYLVSAEAVDEILADWGTLARKHGVLPTSLPIRHSALKHEKEGSKGAAERLPIALEAEAAALEKFETACTQLRQARVDVASQIMSNVNQRLPSLGMESSLLSITVAKVRSCRDPAAFGSNPILGCDAVDLTLEKINTSKGQTGARKGTVEESASSGEKARLLLALECASPGVISAMTKSASALDVDFDVDPAITIFDEIDAHVGGRAAVAVAHMLAEQVDKTQILAITHSPSVAAIANSHLVVRKIEDSSQSSKTSVRKVVGEQRQLELARMTSGDVAPDEAIAFAEALMRDISKKQKETVARKNHFDVKGTITSCN